MRKSVIQKLLVLGAVVTPLMAFGAGTGPGLVGGHHDFTASNTAHSAYVSGDAVDADGAPITDVGLCTYCHTPHKAINDKTLLLWNHTLSTQTFSWTDPTTTAGTTLPSFTGNTWTGASAKCLSCHDGTVAIGDVALFIEEPHTGANALSAIKMGDIDGGNFVIANSTTGSLDGNHPVAVPYPFANASNTYNGVTTGSSIYLDEWQADPQTLGIRLFTDTASSITAGATAGSTGIECSSCHDPHDKQTIGDLFLRGELSGTTGGTDTTSGYLCLKCHIK